MGTRWTTLVLFVMMLAFSGCQTVQGAAEGFKKDVEAITHPSPASPIMKADAWLQKNLW
jgi:hypothetical protein